MNSKQFSKLLLSAHHDCFEKFGAVIKSLRAQWIFYSGVKSFLIATELISKKITSDFKFNYYLLQPTNEHLLPVYPLIYLIK